ncbi:MAG: carotenoid biosynthesis protein [Kiritimatiellae bacterium]|nr:carotenoid biosynthesis protein [Kiritimatiellia bacterium]
MRERAPGSRDRGGLPRGLRWAIAGVYLIFWIGGLGSYLMLGGPPEGSEWAAPMFLWIGGALMAAQYAPRDAGKLVIVGIAGWASEWLGVRTGIPFGSYHYTDALGPAIAGAPLAMIPAWILLAGYARAVLGDTDRRGRWAAALLGAGWMTAVDLIIDPLAAGPLGYWAWDHKGAYFGIPATNFAGWMLVSAVLLAFLGPVRAARGAKWTGASIVAFFSVIAAGTAGYVWVAVIGALLLALQATIARRTGVASSAG